MECQRVILVRGPSHEQPPRKLPGLHLPLTYVSVTGCVNLGVVQMNLGCRECRLFRQQIGPQFHVLRFQDAFGAGFGFAAGKLR